VIEGKGVTALDAKMALADWRINHRTRAYDSSGSDADLQLTANTAIYAGRSCPICNSRSGDTTAIGQSAHRTHNDTGTAADTGTRAQSRARIWNNMHVAAAIQYMPDKLALNAVANIYTTQAIYALRHIHLNMRVRKIDSCATSTLAYWLNVVGAEQTMELLVRFACIAGGQDFFGFPLQDCAAKLFDRSRVCCNSHAIIDQCAPPYLRMNLPLNFDATKATTADGVDARVKAQGRNIDADASRQFEDRLVAIGFELAFIYRQSYHQTQFPPSNCDPISIWHSTSACGDDIMVDQQR